MNSRPDLPNKIVLTLLSLFVVSAVVIALLIDFPKPAMPMGQLLGTVGGILLLAPALFLILKRSGMSKSPIWWFSTHVLSAFIGALFVISHSSQGNLLSPPGLLLVLMLILVVHGAVLRGITSTNLAHLFARNATVSGYSKPEALDKAKLRSVIKTKEQLLLQLDSKASEAIFSPNLKHWLRHPILAFKYQRLAQKEAAMVGARSSAGVVLGWSRRLHITVAFLFFAGLLAHVIIVLFFAGYAAEGKEISWWYLTDWGG